MVLFYIINQQEFNMSSNHNPLPPEDMEDCLGFDTYEDVIEFLISVTGDPDVKLKVSYAQDDEGIS